MLFTITRLHRNNILKMGSTLCPPHNSCIYIELLIQFFLSDKNFGSCWIKAWGDSEKKIESTRKVCCTKIALVNRVVLYAFCFRNPEELLYHELHCGHPSTMVLLVTVFFFLSYSLSYLTDLLALRKKRKKDNGSCILNFTASWILRMFPKMEWSLLSCLSR